MIAKRLYSFLCGVCVFCRYFTLLNIAPSLLNVDCTSLFVKGRAQAIQVLVELGASTEAVDDNGNTPLRLSTCRADLPSIVALLDNGSNVEAVGQYGMTPLHWASLCGNIGAVETLVLERAIITAKDKWGCTPLVMYGKYCPRRIGGAEIAAATALLTPTSQDLLKLSTVQCQQRK
eukprot:GILI01029707.1.p1 GENE.GILI01029707.1~~GILI01029707.1.p1  ORF type:complete len:176 (+),score=2.24 GILI01029707.1:186-713(+)